MGALAYRFVKKVGKNRYVNASLNTKSADHKRFVEIMVHILITLPKPMVASATIRNPNDSAVFIAQLQFSGAQVTWLNDVIEAAKTTSESLDSLAREFNNQFGVEAQLMLLNMVYNVAYSDGEFHDSEARLIDRLAVLLNISAFDHQRIKMAFEAQYGNIQSNDDKYFATLGLTNTANKAEIKKTYRELSKKYHPDKVHHLGDEFKEQAKKKMQDINMAYDELMKRVPA